MRTPILLSGLLLAAGLLSGCSCSGADPATPGDPNDPNAPGNPQQTIQSLALSPQDVTLYTDGLTSHVQEFRVTATYGDGTTADVTSQATFLADDAQIGTFSGNVFASGHTRGGLTVVRAQVGDRSARTNLTLVMRTQVRDTPPAGGPAEPPADSGTRFGGEEETSASLKPRLVYPNDGVMVPPNLGKLEIHFTKGNTSYDLFELTFANARTDVKVYTRCYLAEDLRALPSDDARTARLATPLNNACIYTPTAEVWRFIAETNRGGAPVSIRLRATTAAGGKVGVSDAVAVRFSQSDIKGALYYWTTSSPVGVVRFDFAGTNAAAQSVMTSSNISTSVSCVGCHALSRNGKKLVAEVNGQNDGRLALRDLSSTNATVSLAASGAKLSVFESWNPDGTEFVGVYADSGATDYNLRRFPVNETTVGAGVSIPGTGTQANPANHPDWSPDGNTIAFTRIGQRSSSTGDCGTNQRMCAGSIWKVTRDGAGWSSPVRIAATPTGGNRFYPAIAPDSSFVVFNESTCTGGDDDTCNADTDPTAKLLAAKLEQDAAVVEFTRANRGGLMDGAKTALTNSYPKWSPFVLKAGNSELPGNRLMYLTFSSSRRYGVRKAPSNEVGTLLWMAAVDPDKVVPGEDPSFPAFALPFQKLDTSNHIAQWAEYLVENNCKTVGEGCTGAGACCNGLQCVDPSSPEISQCDVPGKCSCQPIPECKASGTTCSGSSECCSGLTCNNASGQVCSGPSCGTCGVPVLN